MDLSLVIPLYNEEESIKELVDWIERVVTLNGYSYEIILIDDGSNDNSWNVIEDITKHNGFVRAIRFRRNYGKSAALFSGFQLAEGKVVVTLDADLQDSPEEIPGLVNMILKDGYDLVSGWKRKRYDPLSKTIPSRFFNYTARVVTGIKLNDFNCGLKAYRKEVIKSIEVYGEMHRYIPMMAKQAGFHKIGERVVQHQKRKYGVTKFGIERFINGFLDLMSLTFVSRFGKRPMHLFGTLGTLMFIVGFISSAYLGVSKLVQLSHGIASSLVTSSPYFFMSLAAMIIGTQLFLAGFIAELISRNSPFRNSYEIDKKINF